MFLLRYPPVGIENWHNLCKALLLGKGCPMADIRWFLSGKHPMFADYLNLGSPSSLALTFNKWVIQGFEQFIGTGGLPKQGCSYRFWGRTGERHGLILGLLKESTDSVGRPFPLLILGTSSLPDWQKHRSRLISHLEGIWSRLEEIAAGIYDRPAAMESDLIRITLPALAGTSPGCTGTAPNTTFIGSCRGKTTTVSFTEPLTLQDFIRLWTSDS